MGEKVLMSCLGFGLFGLALDLAEILALCLFLLTHGLVHSLASGLIVLAQGLGKTVGSGQDSAFVSKRSGSVSGLGFVRSGPGSNLGLFGVCYIFYY